MEKQSITEEMQIHKEWYEKAKSQTVETLPEFINHLLNNYNHDYGTICHALAAGGIATMWAMNNHEQGGITGFQSGAVMWEFIRNWNYSSNKLGLRILDYDNLLYPQSLEKFQPTITPSCRKALIKEAEVKIDEHEAEVSLYINFKLPEYQKEIAAFKSKYPDYETRPEYYNRLVIGNSEQWEAERKKEESGFEFAPSKPYQPYVHPDVLEHWKRLATGIMPFPVSE